MRRHLKISEMRHSQLIKEKDQINTRGHYFTETMQDQIITECKMLKEFGRSWDLKQTDQHETIDKTEGEMEKRDDDQHEISSMRSEGG